MASNTESPLNSALRQFEVAEANLEKAERVWREIEGMIPKGLCFGSDPVYEEHIRVYSDILTALPKIDGWKPETIPPGLNAIGQTRFDLNQLMDPLSEISFEESLRDPGRELAEYRHRLNKKRGELVRRRIAELVPEIDGTIQTLSELPKHKGDPAMLVKSTAWERLKDQVTQIESLLGTATPRPPRWPDLRRHLHFGMVQDLRDIIQIDWPESKVALSRGVYEHNEPIPVDVEDLGALAAAQPTGSVVTILKWESLTDEDFERLIFSLICSASGYENPEWLMRTHAPDRGRDLSVVRVMNDSLGGTIRSRVMIQCKHWKERSVGVPDFAALKEQIGLWDPPRVDVLIIVTSGRFTSDAVAAIERHNAGDRALRVEMWPESHLERLLAERPTLIAEFGLR